MRIKDSRQNSTVLATANTIRQKKKYIAGAVVFYTFLVFIGGYFVHSSGVLNEKALPLLRQNVRAIPKIAGGLLAQPERIVIDIKHEDFQKLAYQREVALHSGVLVKGADDFVPASIRYKDKVVKVKMRLKGDWTDHLKGDKWSFRIKVRGENSLFGMKLFSIHHPNTRNYLNEWVFHQVLKREGLIGLRYDFISVTLNGKDLGIYALEEHFEKRLIENNQLREGPIIKFNENLLWLERQQQRMPFPNAWANGAGYYLSSDIDGFQTNKWMNTDPAMRSLYLNAIHLLESFRRGQLETSEVFDVQKLAKFYALVDLMGAKHTALWHNSRFYYNPVTARLEAIGFDATIYNPIEYILATNNVFGIDGDTVNVYNDFGAMIFKDPAFVREYIGNLERVSKPAYLDAFFAEMGDAIKEKLNILYSEFPEYEFQKDIFYQNQQYIKTVLDPVKGLHAYYRETSGDEIELEIGNIQGLPVEVLYVSYRDSLKFAPTQETLLSSRSLAKPIQYRSARFRLPAHFTWADTLLRDLKIHYSILGASRAKTETIFPYPVLDSSLTRNGVMREKPNVDSFGFLAVDDSAKTITVMPGSWKIDRNLIIPAGYTVVCQAGTQLDLSGSAKILSYSPLQFTGTASEPVIIASADSTAQGIVVMNAGEKSVLRYVRFDNLSNPAQGAWKLTGAVTFYESPVEISHSEFANNRSEDGLNIVRSDYTIDNTLFTGTRSDAFDADFANGKITNSTFVNCGNDAIDISGSLLEVRNVVVDGAGDKGLSAGENSRMTVDQAEIRNTEIAIASKDFSDMIISNITLRAAKIGFTPFQKKAEFGPATIRVTSLKMENIKIPYLVEQNSTLVVEGAKIPPSRENVKEILYGVEYGKSSR